MRVRAHPNQVAINTPFIAAKIGKYIASCSGYNYWLDPSNILAIIIKNTFSLLTN